MPSSRLDCAQLLSLCSKVEEDAFHFGHPPAPQLEMVQYPAIDVTVIVARTVHGVCVHVVVGGDASNTNPSVLLRLRNKGAGNTNDDPDEEITALKLVQMPNEGSSNPANASISILLDANNATIGLSTSGSVASVNSSQSGTTISTLATNASPHHKARNKIRKKKKLLVCVGTSLSRFFCIQLTVAATGVRTSAPWQPFPLHTTGLFSASSSSGVAGSGVRSIVTWKEEQANILVRVADSEQDTNNKSGKMEIKPNVATTNAITVTYVWISFGDGTLFRVAAHALLKPEKDIQEESETAAPSRTREDRTKEDFLKVQTLLPNHDSTYTVIPCQACPSHWIHDEVPGSFSALVYPNAANASAGLGDVQPTLTSYTSRDTALPQHPQLRELKSRNVNTNPENDSTLDGDHHDDDDMHKDSDSELLNVAIGATSALIRGVAGMVKWGWRQGNKASGNNKNATAAAKRRRPSTRGYDTDSGDEDDDDENEERIYFPQAYKPATLQLTATYEVHDAPRHIQHLQVIHGAAVLADTLGRIQWMELEQHFTITKLWKGHREAVCIPMTAATVASSKQDNSATSLVIYSGQRKSLEVWQLHPKQQRLQSRQLGRDAQVVPCTIFYQPDGYGTEMLTASSCFLLESDGKARATMLTELYIDTHMPLTSTSSGSPEASVVSMAASVMMTQLPPRPPNSSTIASPSPHHDAHLQMLQQMLSNTNVPHTEDDVFGIFSQISNLQQLCQALDLLAVTPAVKGQSGSTFPQKCLKHCRNIYKKTTTNQTADVTQSPPVLELEGTIQLHSQLISAFDALHTFEIGVKSDEDDDTRIKAKSAWAIEGMAWLHTSDTISHGDDAESHKAMVEASAASSFPEEPITFSRLCQCCNIAGSTRESRGSNSKYNVLLSDSSRTRKEFLMHLFSPLLKDVFSYKVVSNVIDELGLQELAIQQYVGEWFMTVSPALAAHKTFFALYSPISRWIQDLVAEKVDALIEANQPLPNVLLSELHTFCSEADDLVRAFLLAAACRECISAVVKKREAKTYGKVWKAQAVKPWDELLRKLRVSMLLSLRLYGIPLGPFPITVKHLADGTVFSMYELVARDELECSHKHEEIVALEMACQASGLVFDPSSPVGDDPSRWRVLQKACLASAISEAERAEYLVELETEVQGALLLYLSHYNNPPLLCAHRALLLAQQWIEEPKRVELLRDCLDALAALSEGTKYAGAIRLEIWQTCIRPVFRAFLFGFDDVQEIQEEVYFPLMQNVDWMVRMGKAGLSILSLIEKSGMAKSDGEEAESDVEAGPGWPALGTDALLESLVQKFRPVDQNALDVHRVIVSGCMVSTDVQTLSECVEGFYEAFVSLYQPSGSPGGDSEKQLDFLEQAIICRAESLHKPILDRFNLDEIETLALLWSIDVRDVRTIFLLAMYEFGKDTVVDDLLTRMSSQRGMDLTRFLEDGIGIVCRRLHQMLHVKRSHEIRSLLGLLDADTTEWIRDQADGTFSLLEDETGVDRVVLDVPLQSTHFFVLRLMSIAVSYADKDTRVKLHSLSVLTGTLLKELEKEPQR